MLLAPVWTLAYLGLSRWPRAGRVLAVAMFTVSAWILAGTWTVKLFPMYAQTTLAPAAALYAGRAIALALIIAAWALLARQYAARTQ